MITIIPAIDLMDGKCVRLTGGDYSTKKIYREDPVEVAREFEDAGLKRLHIVDLDGARRGHVCNLRILEQISKFTKLLTDYGGGIKTTTELESVISAGVTYVSVGSMAVKQPAVFDGWIQKYGADIFFLGADVRNGKIAVSGWEEQTEIDVTDFIRGNIEKRVSHVFCTDIAHDGMMLGPADKLYKKILSRCPGLRLVASGGIRSMEDIHLLDQLGCDGVIVGKAIYEGKISLKELGALS